MTRWPGRGSRRTTAPEPATEAGGDGAPPATAVASSRHLVHARLTTRAVSVCLFGCLLAGPAALGLGLVAMAAPSISAAPAGVAPSVDSSAAAAAGEAAQTLVVAWLGSTRTDPAVTALVPGVDVASLPAAPAAARDAAVAAISRVGSTWSVTVGVTVTDQAKTTARRYFQVPVLVSGGSVTVVALPAPVAGPSAGSRPPLAYGHPVGVSDPVGVAVSGFLSAYLAGTGDVTRYAAPGVNLRPVAPAPYTSVLVTDLTGDVEVSSGTALRDDSQVRVLASVQLSVSSDQAYSGTYALTLRARAGRWEISAIDPAPALAQGGADPAPSASSSSTPVDATPSKGATDAADPRAGTGE